jgi:Tol biopolymer transport system component
MRRTLALILGFVISTVAGSSVTLADDNLEVEPLLAVSTNRFGPTFELVTIDVHGEHAELVLPFRCEAENPCWSPDLRKIAYRSKKSGQLQLYVYDFDRNEETNVTKTSSGEHEPTWSPDGNKMLFTSQRTGNHELFVVNADGSNPVNLTNNSAFDSDPAWSPDGKKIAFGSSRGNQWRLYVMDADGSNVRDVLGHALGGWTGPNWSPDGSQIVYVGPNNGSLQIFVVSADGTGAQPITDSRAPAANTWPVYSPDGRYIAYAHYDTPQHDEKGTLMVYDIETLEHRPVAPGGMRTYSRVSWKPRPRDNAPPVDPFRPRVRAAN